MEPDAIDSSIEGKSQDYANLLSRRVRSFNSDPLHSTAYLADFAGYLQKPFRKEVRVKRVISPRSSSYPFVSEYQLSSNGPQLARFHDVKKYGGQKIPEDNRGNMLVFLTGRPSPDWLNVVGSRYHIDHRFFQQHLSFLPSGQRDWYTSPSLPSRSRNTLRLCIPSIVFVGAEGRYVDPYGLQRARNNCDLQLLGKFSAFYESPASDAGHSIVRRVNIHSGDCFVLEQEASICVLGDTQIWTVLIWSDSGDDDCKDCIPTPSTEHFKEALNNVEFCPIFFEKGLVETTLKPQEIQSPRGRQPFSALPSKYGETLDWSKAHLAPLYALEELLHFQATSMSQYLNLLERVISKHLPTVEHPELVQTKMEDILHFEYAKTVLVRHSAYVRETIDFVKGPLQNWNTEKTNDLDFSQTVSTVEGDFQYLLDRIQSLVEFCEAGKSSIMSNAAIAESRQANDEAKLVTQLTKATNRVTFIFLPISFVTSVFGMNFRQFGQGNLTILWWVAITLPLLAVSVLLVERWNVLQGWVRGVPKWLSHKER